VEAFTWDEAMTELADSVNYDHAALEVTIVILYVIVGIGTINTLLMSVMERTREFGVIRAIGTSKANIRKMVFSEALVLGLVGVSLGMVLAVVVGLYTSTHGIDFSSIMEEQGMGGVLIEPIIRSTWDVSGMFMLGCGMLIVSLLASLYPVHHVMKIEPSEAMRMI
jgi:ABC-type lipoprotein release transport system permease subunit